MSADSQRACKDVARLPAAEMITLKRRVAFLLTLCIFGAARAAEQRDAEKSAPPSAATSRDATAAPPSSDAATTIPNPYKLNLLIRTTIIALNQANATGNYSVLRDLAAMSFQKANNPARLAEIFSDIRRRDLDLSGILFFEPKLVRPPSIQPNGHLRLSGYFETSPEQVRFDLAFERGAKDWLLFGIAVEVAAPQGDTLGKAAEPVKGNSGIKKSAPGPAPSKAVENKPGPRAPAEPARSKTTP